MIFKTKIETYDNKPRLWSIHSKSQKRECCPPNMYSTVWVRSTTTALESQRSDISTDDHFPFPPLWWTRPDTTTSSESRPSGKREWRSESGTDGVRRTFSAAGQRKRDWDKDLFNRSDIRRVLRCCYELRHRGCPYLRVPIALFFIWYVLTRGLGLRTAALVYNGERRGALSQGKVDKTLLMPPLLTCLRSFSPPLFHSSQLPPPSSCHPGNTLLWSSSSSPLSGTWPLSPFLFIFATVHGYLLVDLHDQMIRYIRRQIIVILYRYSSFLLIL